MTRYVLISEIVGSSPLARGLPPCRLRGTRPARIIPARAGFTRFDHVGGALRWDHPRSRGVYVLRQRIGANGEGSSPLARGLLARVVVISRSRRIIPARAGFTGRTCNIFAATGGSSPLARGLQRSIRRSSCNRRIIPARAGFTHAQLENELIRGDHPRSRGVYPSEAQFHARRGGSSPLARGLHVVWYETTNDARIIPARAGFTAVPEGERRDVRDHPRSRGVYLTSSSPASM